MVFRPEDVRWAMAGPGGVDVLYRGTTYRGFYNREQMVQTDATGETVLVRRETVEVVTGEPDAAIGETLVVDGITKVVRDSQEQGDGATTLLTVTSR